MTMTTQLTKKRKSHKSSGGGGEIFVKFNLNALTNFDQKSFETDVLNQILSQNTIPHLIASTITEQIIPFIAEMSQSILGELQRYCQPVNGMVSMGIFNFPIERDQLLLPQYSISFKIEHSFEDPKLVYVYVDKLEQLIESSKINGGTFKQVSLCSPFFYNYNTIQTQLQCTSFKGKIKPPVDKDGKKSSKSKSKSKSKNKSKDKTKKTKYDLLPNLLQDALELVNKFKGNRDTFTIAVIQLILTNSFLVNLNKLVTTGLVLERNDKNEYEIDTLYKSHHVFLPNHFYVSYIFAKFTQPVMLKNNMGNHPTNKSERLVFLPIRFATTMSTSGNLQGKIMECGNGLKEDGREYRNSFNYSDLTPYLASTCYSSNKLSDKKTKKQTSYFQQGLNLGYGAFGLLKSGLNYATDVKDAFFNPAPNEFPIPHQTSKKPIIQPTTINDNYFNLPPPKPSSSSHRSSHTSTASSQKPSTSSHRSSPRSSFKRVASPVSSETTNSPTPPGSTQTKSRINSSEYYGMEDPADWGAFF